MSTPTIHMREASPALINYEQHNVDATVVGMGVLGLMVAKRLVDFGQRVAVIEEQPHIAAGPSIKNHGWLHTGTVHSLSVEDPTKARKLVQKLQYGHRFFASYAPECLTEPLTPSYAVARDPALAKRAQHTWKTHGVPHEKIPANNAHSIEPDLSIPDTVSLSRTGDSRINNRLLFARLLNDITRGGAIALTGATYEYDDNETLRVQSQQGSHRISSPLHFYTTGTGVDDSYQKLTGDRLGVEYWKSHLLFVPRFSQHSLIGLDRNSPIVINHGNTAVVNRSYDEVARRERDITVDQSEVDEALQTLKEQYPLVPIDTNNVRAIACLKPHIPAAPGAKRHAVDEIIITPQPRHIFALPGKMTEAPYVADTLIQQQATVLNLDAIAERPMDKATKIIR